MTTFPPTPFPWKGATLVRGQSPLRVDYWSPPWGGPAEATK